MSDGLSHEDRRWLETRFQALEAKMDAKDSKINNLAIDVNTLKVGSVHKCAEEIQKHEAGSWSHNPKKALGLGVAIIGAIEGVRKFFGH